MFYDYMASFKTCTRNRQNYTSSKYTYDKKTVVYQKIVFKFYSLGKINSVDELIKLYYLIQTQERFKKNRSPITVLFVHSNTNTPEIQNSQKTDTRYRLPYGQKMDYKILFFITHLLY